MGSRENSANYWRWATAISPLRQTEIRSTSRRTIAALAIFVGLAYYLGAQLGLALTFQPNPISVLWPPNSILLAGLLLAPARAWPVLLIAALAAHLGAELDGGFPLVMVLCWFISNSLQAVIGAALLRVSVYRRVPDFNRLRDLFAFLAYGALLAPFAASFVDTGFIKLMNVSASDYWELWRLRFFSNVLAAIILVPPILTWSQIGREALRNISLQRLLEAAVFTVGLLAVTFLAFTERKVYLDWAPALLYAPLPFLLWAAVRFGPRGTSSAVLIIALLTIWESVHGQGPFTVHSTAQNALSIQLFLSVISIPFLTLAAVIEERKRAVAALRESEARMAIVLEAAQVGTWDWSIDRDRVAWSDESERIFGIAEPISRFDTEALLKLVHPDDQPAVSVALNHAVKHGSPYVVEYRVARADGTMRWVMSKGRAIHGKSASATRLVGVNVDITQRKLAEEALRASEERFAQAFRFGPDALAIVRRSDGGIMDVNERWEAIFGYARDEVLGKTAIGLNLYVRKQDRDVFFVQAIDAGFVRGFETDLRNRSGEVRRTILSAHALEIGNVPGFIMSIRDVTEQRLAERQSQEQREQLTHLTRVAVLGQLSGALAHELNQPLTAILSNAQAAQRLLARGSINPVELAEILEDIAHEDKRAGEVIKCLRALLKKGEAHLQPLNLNELVRSVLDLAHAELIRRNVTAAVDLADDVPNVRGDRVQLQQVLLNLVLNACEAMAGRPQGERELLISTHVPDGSSMELRVRDSGCGIAPDLLPRLFTPFTTTKIQGLGLGLSISRSVIAAHGGTIVGQNNEGRGATFRIMVPAILTK